MKGKQEIRKQTDDLFFKVKEQTVVPAVIAARGLTLPVNSLRDVQTGQVGVLRGDVKVEIQTRQAQVLLTGREPTPERPNRVMGLMAFSRYLAEITAAVKEDDDPWADWILVIVEEKLKAAETAIAEQQGNVQRVLGSVPMMDIQVAESVKSMTVSIGFSASHAYWVARVITQYDTLVRMVLTGRHAALIPRDSAELLLADAAQVIRRVFESTARYQRLRVSRDDVLNGVELAQQAEKRMGRVPADILDRTRKAEFAPAGRSAQSAERGVVTAPVVEKVAKAVAADKEKPVGVV